MTDDTLVQVVAYAAGTIALWVRQRQSVPLTVYQPKITELHNTINAQGKEIVELQGDNKLLRVELEHLKASRK